MLLSVRMLKDVQTVNSFEPDTELNWTEGDSLDIYFQLVDLNLDRPEQGFYPSGRRYVPAAGATLQCSFECIDNAKTVTRFAVQPFANDGSIWKISILSTDPIRGSPQLRLKLTEGAKTTRGLSKLGLRVYPKSNV